MTGVDWDENANGPALPKQPGPGTGRVSPECTVTLQTLADAARLLHDAVRDRRYQRETKLGASVADYLAWKRLSSSERTLAIYEGYLARLCVDLAHVNPAIDEVTPSMLLEALAVYPQGSLRIVRTSYSDFFKWACRWGHRDRNPVDLLPRIPESPTKVYDVFTPAEQARLIAAADTLPLPWIQRLRVLCLLDLGIRKEEARGLQPLDFDTTSKVVVVRGKGNKERMVPFSDELWRAFIAYRNRPIPNVRTDVSRVHRPPLDTDYLFFRHGVKSGAITWTDPHKPISQRGLHSWWAEYVIPAAGVRYRSMHMNRHTVGTDLASAEADAFTIRDWLGHADVSTTQVYVHNSRSRLRRGRSRLDDYRHRTGG